MSNFRVVVSGNSSDGYILKIEDIYLGKMVNMHQFVNHQHGITSSSSIEDLKNKLIKMLAACDLPVLVFSQKLEELDHKKLPNFLHK